MQYVDYKCKNCGANIDINDSRVAYCEFCGSQIVREDKTAREYYEEAVELFSLENDPRRLDAVNYAMIFNADNSDLMLMKAMLLKKPEFLKQIKKEKLTKCVKAACEKEFSKWKPKIEYTIPWGALSRAPKKEIDRISVLGDDIQDNESIKTCFAFAGYLFSAKKASLYKDKIEDIDKQSKEKATKKLNEIKAQLKKDLNTGWGVVCFSSFIILLGFIIMMSGSLTSSTICIVAGFVGFGVGGKIVADARRKSYFGEKNI